MLQEGRECKLLHSGEYRLNYRSVRHSTNIIDVLDKLEAKPHYIRTDNPALGIPCLL